MNTIEGNIYTVMRSKDQCYVFCLGKLKLFCSLQEAAFHVWREMWNIIVLISLYIFENALDNQ
jgi:hypothetical protein